MTQRVDPESQGRSAARIPCASTFRPLFVLLALATCGAGCSTVGRKDLAREVPATGPAAPAARLAFQSPPVEPGELPELPEALRDVPPSAGSQARDDSGGREIPVAPPIPLEVVPAPTPESEPPARPDAGVSTVACATCGRGLLAGDPGLLGSPGPPQCASCGGPGCVPGRKSCNHIEAHTMVGRFFGALYECLCCPDPCYQPQWIPEANAAFFTDYARPQTLTRIRVDNGIDMVLPDRAEFFWARSDGKGLGPPPPKFTPHPRTPVTVTTTPPVPAGRPPGLTGPILTNGPFGRPAGLVPAATHARRATHAAATGTRTLHTQTGLDYHDLYYYQEVGANRASFFIETPYRFIEPYLGPTHSGFGDLNMGTKSMLLDCELLQATLQFKTYLPVGASRLGLGTGHVSLEPSLLATLRLTPSAFLQGQIAEWIPLGGGPGFAGALIHYHLSANQTLCRLTPDSPLIGTLEFSGWSFQNGSYTDPYLGPRRASGETYLSAGPGLRLVICNSYDVGLGTQFALTDPHWTSTLYRLEFRVRF